MRSHELVEAALAPLEGLGRCLLQRTDRREDLSDRERGLLCIYWMFPSTSDGGSGTRAQRDISAVIAQLRQSQEAEEGTRDLALGKLGLTRWDALDEKQGIVTP